MMFTLLKFSKKLLAGLVALPLLFSISTVQAAPIGLALVIDGSGSISSGNFGLQKTGYVAALNSVIPGHYGNVAIGVYQFSSSAQTEFSMTLISGATELGNLTTAISGMSQLGGNTSIGSGIQQADNDMASYGYASLEKAVIDVSTDGFNNRNPTPGAVIPAFLTAAGSTVSGQGVVNCLGIGGSANCGFIAGPGAFSVTSSDFNIQSALEEKLRRELGEVPEPSVITLLGLGLLGLGLTRRKKLS